MAEKIWRDARRDLASVLRDKLVEACAELKLTTTGTKAVLLGRLEEYFGESRRGGGASSTSAALAVAAPDVVDRTPEMVWRDARRNLPSVLRTALVDACVELSLPTSGTKPVLLSRLDEHFGGKDSVSKSSSDASHVITKGIAGLTLAGGISKHALCVGISKYVDARPLANPENDATAMAEAVRSLGFTVHEALSPRMDKLEETCKVFLSHVKRGSSVLVFLAGHGEVADSKNYLLPADFGEHDPVNAKYAFCYQTEIVDKLERIGTNLNVILIDACRSNRFLPKREPAAGFLHRGEAAEKVPTPAPDLRMPVGTIVGMACNIGMTALDGIDRSHNGLYTTALLRHIKARMPILTVLTEVNAEVQRLLSADPRTKSGVQISNIASTLIDPHATIFWRS